MVVKEDYAKIVKNKISIVEQIGKDVKLSRSGDNFKGLCPFHNEKTPSFVVNETKGTFKCFGCGKGGDIFSYLIEKMGISFKEALELLATQTGVKLDYKILEKVSKNNASYKEYFEIMNMIADFYHQNLKNRLKVKPLSFLSEKKIELEQVLKFHLGLSTNFQELEGYLSNKGVDTHKLEKFGIIKLNKFGKKYDMFNKRLMFPIKDNFSRVIAFGGRTLNEDGPKYINSWENEFFKKRLSLYNINNLKNSEGDNVFVVEGYTDVIAMDKRGLKAVAPLGTALSVDQLNLVWRYSAEPIIFFDGDAPGIEASSRAIDISLPEINSEKTLGFIFAKNNLDPEQIINSDNNDSKISNLLKEKKNYLEALYFLEDKNQIKTPERLLALKKKLLNKIEFIKDNELKNIYKLFIKERIDSEIKNGLYNFKTTSEVAQKENYFLENNKKRSENHFVLRRERSIIGAMINNFKLLQSCDEAFAEIPISNIDLSHLRNKIIDIIASKEITNSMQLKKMLIECGFSKIIKKHFVTNDCIKYNFIEKYAQENADINYSQKAILELINLQQDWYNKKNKNLSKNIQKL